MYVEETSENGAYLRWVEKKTKRAEALERRKEERGKTYELTVNYFGEGRFNDEEMN